jgi:hypothetical protein
MRRLALLILLCILAVSVSACEFSASTATITSAELARGYADGKATDTTTTFSPSDTTLHYVVTLGNAPDDTKVKAVWTAVDVGDGKIKDQKLDESVLQSGSAVLNFTLAGTQAWPTGKYKVDLFLNDKLDRSTDFVVN